MCALECGEEVFLGCKCGSGPPRVRLTCEDVASEEKEDGIERQDDSDGWGDRKGRQREWQVDVRRRNDGQDSETEYEKNGGRREDGDVWNGDGQEEDDPRTQGEGSGVCTRGKQANWEDWVRRVERRFDERQRLEGQEEDKRWEVDWRSERREGKGEEHEEMRQVKGEIGKGKGERKGKRLGEELKGTGGRFPGREGKGKGGFEEQRWWDDWWAMKEWSGDNLVVGDSGQRLRDEQWEEVRSRKLRNASVRMAERLGEEMASELRLAECLGEEARSELNEGMWRKECRRLERGRRVKGRWEGYEEWENWVEEDHRGGFEVLEGQIRRLMERMEEFENERKREDDWRMARFEWLSGMDKGMWLGGKEKNERERRNRGRREKRREWGSSDEESEDGKYESLEERIRGLVERIGGLEGGLGKSEEKGRTRDLRQKETKEIRSGDGMANIGQREMMEIRSGDGMARIGGTRWNVGRRSTPG